MFAYVNKYTVKPGDTLNSIAITAGLSTVRQLLPVNPQIQNPNLIYPGQVINVPKIIPMYTYRVNPGDTLNSIISNYNIELQKYYGVQITLSEVLAYNPSIVNPNLIYPGMIVYLPEIL